MGKNLEKIIIEGVESKIIKMSSLGWFIISALSTKRKCLSKVGLETKKAKRFCYENMLSYLSEKIKESKDGMYESDIYNSSILIRFMDSYKKAKLDQKESLELYLGEKLKEYISEDGRWMKTPYKVLSEIGSKMLEGLNIIEQKIMEKSNFEKRKRYDILVDSIKELF